MLTFGRVAPTIFIRDLPPSLAFYRDILGFAVVFTNGSPPSFAVLQRDGACLHLSVRPELAGSCHAHIMLDNLDALCATFQAAGVTLRQSPQVQPWGLRDLVVADPDGNTFEFAEAAGNT